MAMHLSAGGSQCGQVIPRDQTNAFAHARAAPAMDEHGGLGLGSSKGDSAGKPAEPIASNGRTGFAFDGQQGLAMISQEVDFDAHMVAPEKQVRAFTTLVATLEPENRRCDPSAALHEARNGVSHSIASCALQLGHICDFLGTNWVARKDI